VTTTTYTVPLPDGAAQCCDNWGPDVPFAHRIIQGKTAEWKATR
jgi:hypothetical protein